MLAVGWVNGQIVFDGIVQGLAVAVIAVGVVLIYRATRIINFAVGNMGLVGAVTLSLLTIQYDVPFWAAFAARAGRRTRVRRGRGDRGHPPPAERPSGGRPGVHHRHRRTGADDRRRDTSSDDTSAHYPSAFNGTWNVGGVTIHGSDLSILILAPRRHSRPLLVPRPHDTREDRQGVRHQSVACSALLRFPQVRLDPGLGARRRALHALGRPHRRASRRPPQAWGTSGPQTLSEALAAAVIARFRSFRVAVLAAVVIGVLQSVLTYNFMTVPGITNLLLFIVVFVAVIFAKREDAESEQVFAFSPRARPIPQRLRVFWWARNINKRGCSCWASLRCFSRSS